MVQLISAAFMSHYPAAGRSHDSVHCKLRPRHTLHDGPPSSGSRHNQYHTAEALTCTQRRSDVTRCSGVFGGRTYDTIRYDTRSYFTVRSKADINQLNLPHGNKLKSGKEKN